MSTVRNFRGSVRLQARVTCPHCWHVFSPHDIHWVSQHPDLVGDPRLGAEEQLRFLPTRFTVEGDAIDARGFACHALACPNCHLGIPRALLEMEPLFLSILGTPGSGKSHLLAAMTWHLRKILPQNFALSFGDADPSINLQLNSYEQELFLNPNPDNLMKLPKTVLEGNDLYDTVLFGEQHIRYPQPYVFGLRPLDGHPYFSHMNRLSRGLCLYDNAGEHFLPGTDKVGTPVTRHLAQSRVLFFLFDPTQEPDFRRACTGLSRDPQIITPTKTYRQETVLLEAAERIRRYTGLGQSARHDRPLIVIVTKYDAWFRLLEGASPRLETTQLIRRGKGNLGALDLPSIEEMSARVRAMLWKYRSEFVSAAEGFCQEVLYVPVSALGCTPEPSPESPGDCLVRPRDVQPMWVEVPMLYALARWMQGLVPYVGRQDGTPRPERSS